MEYHHTKSLIYIELITLIDKPLQQHVVKTHPTIFLEGLNIVKNLFIDEEYSLCRF